MGDEKLLKFVRKEVKHLKNNTTIEEKNRLNILDFNGKSPTKCIYGLMTGDCYSRRARQLYKKEFDILKTSETYIKGTLFTALESFLYYNNSNKIVNNIIEYIKGNKQKLYLK